MKFNSELFGRHLRIKAAEFKLNYTNAAKEIGISKATFSRLANESGLPDVDTFATCCEWLNQPMIMFFTKKQ